jgi:hypothetical protein
MTRFHPADILAILDRCCETFTFPMLDNGYVYLAATRLSLFRSPDDWAMVIEVFGFSPRAGLPDIHVHTFASRLDRRDSPEKYVSQAAYEQYHTNNPNNDSRFFHPIAEGPWQDDENPEVVARGADKIVLRGRPYPLPATAEYARRGIDLEHPPEVRVFELCRFLANVARNDVLATPAEQRTSVLPSMTGVLQLDEWHHPDIVNPAERPSGSTTFQQLAQVLVDGDASGYRPSAPPNTDWHNWPDGGTL